MKISATEYQARRKKFLSQLPQDAIAIIPSMPIRHKSADNDYPYHPDMNLYYLTGYTESDCVAVFLPNRKEGEFVLFNLPKIREKEIWTGFLVGQEEAVKQFKADQAFVIDEFAQKLLELMQGRNKLYYALGRYAEWDEVIIKALNDLKRKVRQGIKVPEDIVNVEAILFEMRLIKSAEEIELMRHVGQISVAAHKRLMKACSPGMFEYQLQAELEYEFMYQGCQEPAYTSIVAGGENAIVLHYISNRDQVKEGDLLLVDAGGQYEYYASDITTTFPVNGKFTPEQKLIYDLVLKAQLETFKLIKPGTPWWSLQENIFRILTEGLVELGILQGDLEKLLAEKAVFKFYMHNSGHWLGLDTHDVGAYKVDGQWRPLQSGMVLTVEPGLYLSKDIAGLDPKWHGIGVRIEDDLVVTETGYDILTKGLPRTTEEIEVFMAS
ncbi:MAG: pepP [Gammaproteobacteria bacterium]|jgi:Xaa-Pro aminopeptidase|nr:pepP [Gammaproteobacteria bacterium]